MNDDFDELDNITRENYFAISDLMEKIANKLDKKIDFHFVFGRQPDAEYLGKKLRMGGFRYLIKIRKNEILHATLNTEREFSTDSIEDIITWLKKLDEIEFKDEK